MERDHSREGECFVALASTLAYQRYISPGLWPPVPLRAQLLGLEMKRQQAAALRRHGGKTMFD